MNLGIEELLDNSSFRVNLQGKRVAFLGHNASATRDGLFSLEALMKGCTLRLCKLNQPLTNTREKFVPKINFLVKKYLDLS